MQGSHWFLCTCVACTENWNCLDKLPRDYLKLPGTSFKYKRCDRRELQKDVEKTKARIRQAVKDKVGSEEHKEEINGSSRDWLESVREMYNGWMALLEELIVPPHQGRGDPPKRKMRL